MWGRWIPEMAVPSMTVVNVGLAAVFLGGGTLLLVALWWALASDGVSLPRERWGVMRGLATVGWVLWIGGLVVQVAGFFGQVGVARWPSSWLPRG